MKYRKLAYLALLSAMALWLLVPNEVALGLQGGATVADNGFRPKANGFNFPNYGNDKGYQNLMPEDVRRLFGDQACGALENGVCELTPAGQQWMEEVNDKMDGGHCDGFAALSGLIYAQQLDATDLGGNNLYNLKINTNEKLQREIAYWWATQTLRPTQDGYIFGTPSEILEKLVAGLKAKKESYTVAVRMEGKGGHAVTPYAVQDMGGGIYNVLVYDNNHPGVERRIIVDTNNETWEYNLSTRPDKPESIWRGNDSTKTFLLKTNSYRVSTQNCPFCEDSAGAAGHNGLEQAVTRYNQIWVDGENVHVLLTDAQGRRFGLVNGKMVKEIPNVKFQGIDSAGELWEDSSDPVYYVPVGIQFTISIDAANLKEQTEASIAMIGPGYDLEVEAIRLDPGQKDSIKFAADGKSITYQTDSNESPIFVLGYETKGADYSFFLRGMEVDAGSAMTLNLDKDKGLLSVSSKGGKQTATYMLTIARFENLESQYFSHDNVQLEPKDTAIINYTKWAGKDQALTLGIDRDSDGSIDETLELTDEYPETSGGGLGGWLLGGALLCGVVVLGGLAGGAFLIFGRKKK